MRAVWLHDRHVTVRDDVPIPVPAETEALVRVVRAGICNTDLELTRGYYPFTGVLGHEFVGIAETGPQQLVGKRVVGEINTACGGCGSCSAGHKTHCENRTVLGIAGRDGAFAEWLTLPRENLHVVPDAVSTDAATFTEPLAAALEIQEQVDVGRDDRVLVVGDGKLGQLVGQTLALTGCDLVVVGRHRSKLDLLAKHGIATVLSDAAPAGVFDIAVECTGNSDGVTLALQALRPRGTLVLKSTYAGSLTLDPAAVVVNELTLLGSRCGPFAPALRLLADASIDVEPLIHARFALGDGVAALEQAACPGVMKVLLDVG
jgi:threonine dehydrogenase-like Zn-dependent dehydrogenase